MTAAEIEPRWIGDGQQRRFAVLVRPADKANKVRGALLFVPPFGEEMNKSRRMAATAARALASDGWAILMLDLAGCGDSPGHLEQASWNGWLDDVARAHDWLGTHTGIRAGLWGMRAGALLAAAAARTIDAVPRLVLWQPALSGKTHLTQFLRLKVAGEALAGAREAVSTADLFAQLRNGEVLDIAGYRLPPAVALPLADAALDAPVRARHVDWLEVNAQPQATPASQRVIDAWRASGLDVHAEAVVGPPFWQTQELEDCPALIEATTRVCRADG